MLNASLDHYESVTLKQALMLHLINVTLDSFLSSS